MSPQRRIDVSTAAALIAARMPSYPSVAVPLAQAGGAILRQSISAERDQPPFHRVTMDGIAIRHAGFAAGTRRFQVQGTQGAGADALRLGGDTACVEIMTGAMLPDDADTVIPVERLQREGNDAVLEAGYAPDAGQFVHLRGSDHSGGQQLLSPGQRIGAAEMAVLTISGSATVEVAQWPAVAVVSTGSELVEPGEAMAPYQIRSSNELAISTALQQRGCQRLSRARLPDNTEQLRRDISALHESHDVLILSGGVSMGKYDYVPQIMQELGVALVFHKILQRPGLPMWFGVSAEGKPVFALPGNPVSSLVCAVRYAIPAIEQALGLVQNEPLQLPLAERVAFAADLTWFLPVQHAADNDGAPTALPRPTNTSGDFVSLAGTSGFLELPRGKDSYDAGYLADFYPW